MAAYNVRPPGYRSYSNEGCVNKVVFGATLEDLLVLGILRLESVCTVSSKTDSCCSRDCCCNMPDAPAEVTGLQYNACEDLDLDKVHCGPERAFRMLQRHLMSHDCTLLHQSPLIGRITSSFAYLPFNKLPICDTLRCLCGRLELEASLCSFNNAVCKYDARMVLSLQDSQELLTSGSAPRPIGTCTRFDFEVENSWSAHLR